MLQNEWRGTLKKASARLSSELGWSVPSDQTGVMITSGTSGALLLAAMALLNPGDEAIIPDPWFVIYPALGNFTGARMVGCDTYPNFRMTAERVEPLIAERTKFVLLNSPANPAGTVLSADELAELVELCRQKKVLLISDEIYEAFTCDEALDDGRFPAPGRFGQDMLVIRGFGKTCGCTGWRLGYAAGPAPLIRQMCKLQQYTFVCAPSMAQVGMARAFDVDLSARRQVFQDRRDRVVERLAPVTDLITPQGAFYAFVPVPARIGLTATEFVERALERNLLTIPGSVFSQRDTHFRISYAAPDEAIDRGLDILREMLAG